MYSTCVEEINRKGMPGFWPGPFKSTRQIFRSDLSVAKARRFPSREMAGSEALLASRLILLGMRALGYRNPPKPEVGSCSGAEHEFTAIGQPSCTHVRHVARLNFFLFPERFVAFSKMQEP